MSMYNQELIKNCERMNEKRILEIDNCQLILFYSLLGRKWSLPILHSFMENKVQTYTEIRNKFEKKIHPTLLAKRLKSFEKLNIINKKDKEYKITQFGKKINDSLHRIKKIAIEYEISIPEKCKKENCICSSYF